MQKIKLIIINISSVFARILALLIFLMFVQQIYVVIQIGFSSLTETDLFGLVTSAIVSIGGSLICLGYAFIADDWKDYYQQLKQQK